MANYDYTGCVTGFSEDGDTTLLQPSELPMPTSRPANPYTQRLVGVGLLKAGEINCVANGVLRRLPPLGGIGENQPDRYITVSRNGAAPQTIVFNGSPESWNTYDELTLYGKDGVSIAFLDLPFFIDMIQQDPKVPEGKVLVAGIGNDGHISINNTLVDVTERAINLPHTNEISPPHTLVSEINTLTFMPTPNVARDLDNYYLFDGSDTQDSITIHSCAVIQLANTSGDLCVPQPSVWSEPITFDMVNHPNQGGYISVSFDRRESPNYGINLNEVSSIEGFFDKLNEESMFSPFIEYRQAGSNAVQIRYKPRMLMHEVITAEHKPVITEYMKRGAFYEYDASNIGNMGETSIVLADAFSDDVITTVACQIPYDGPIQM